MTSNKDYISTES